MASGTAERLVRERRSGASRAPRLRRFFETRLEKFFTSYPILMQGWLSILLMIGLATGFGVVTLIMSRFVGPHHPTPEKDAPYECGMPPVGDAHERQSVKFYLVAMIFLLFDIEVAFLYPWAMALRQLGWSGYLQIVLFFAVLLVGYAYIWQKGVLEWGERAPTRGR